MCEIVVPKTCFLNSTLTHWICCNPTYTDVLKCFVIAYKYTIVYNLGVAKLMFQRIFSVLLNSFRRLMGKRAWPVRAWFVHDGTEVHFSDVPSLICNVTNG